MFIHFKDDRPHHEPLNFSTLKLDSIHTAPEEEVTPSGPRLSLILENSIATKWDKPNHLIQSSERARRRYRAKGRSVLELKVDFLSNVAVLLC